MTLRIFVSSVVGGFEAERAAARDAIIRMGHSPVMCEDFGARPESSQKACLAEVGSSDIYFGLFGHRYGYVAESSRLGVTEEEFNEARRLGKTILCFEKLGDKEPDQLAFLTRIKAYESGYFIATFRDAEHLKTEIVLAVTRHQGRSASLRMDAAVAEAKLNTLEWGSRRVQSATWLGLALTPDTPGGRIDILDLGRADFRDARLQPAIFGPAQIFGRESGTRTSEEECLIFEQPERGSPSVRLEIHSDGSLVFGERLSRDRANSLDLARIYIIDEDEVARRIEAYLRYAGQHYTSLPTGRSIDGTYIGASLTGGGTKSFGKLPPGPLTIISPIMRGPKDPVQIPNPPMHLSRAELSNPAELSAKLTAHFARAFRIAKACYEHAARSGPRY